VPLVGFVTVRSIRIPGRQIDWNTDPGISVRFVSADYHRTLKIPLLKGRLFTSSDRRGSTPVALINDAAARKYFPGEEPLGRIISIDQDRTIVGVVGDVHQVSLEASVLAEAYLPMAQGSVAGGELAVRTSGNPYDMLPAVKSVVYSVLPDVPLRNVRTMDEVIARHVAQRRLNMLLLSLFAFLGVIIAAVGIYGVMAYLVAQRTREIGVRMALGATRSAVLRMVLLNAVALVVCGLGIGGIASWYLSAASRAFLFGLQPTDPRAFAAAAIIVSIAALAATAIPARRAASVDPVVALRAE
jgi:putative ABC transport system permease protein